MFIILAPGSHLFSCQFTLKPQNFTSQVRLSIKGPSFLNGPTPASFYFFVLFQAQSLQKKTVSFSGIRTRIAVVEGEQDH